MVASLQNRVGSSVRTAAAVLLGLVAAEAFLRLTILPEQLFNLGFTAGIHQPDGKYGFVQSPGYTGYMRHIDGVWNVPLELDEHGLRRETRPGDPQAPQVLLLGGQSMVMSYGLPDSESLAVRLGEQGDVRLNVRAAAWAGIDLYRSWHLYRDRVAASSPPPDAAVLCLYNCEPTAFAWLPEDLQTVPPPPPADVLFRFDESRVLHVEGRLSRAAGPRTFDSVLGYRLLHAVDRRLARWFGRAPLPTDRPGPQDPAVSEQRLTALLLQMQEYFSARGTEMIVVHVPMQRPPRDYAAALRRAVPESIKLIDLHAETKGELRDDDFLANGHYGASAVDAIVAKLRPHVDQALATARLAKRSVDAPMLRR